MKTKVVYYLLCVILFLSFKVNAQDIKPEDDTLHAVIEKIQSEMNVKNRLKISGYIQAQYQKADTAGIESFAGGNFANTLDNRMAVRRGRFKLAYDYNLTQYVLQVDVTEKGVGIKDAYGSFTDPWINTFAFTAGIFDRPFGYEIFYSSSLRESPERSRLFQTLFPGEREIGAKLTINPPKTSRYNFIKLDAGVFNGNGPTTVEFDSQKDFIGHLSLNKSFSQERINIGIGASYYNGGWRQNTKYVYESGNALVAGNEIAAFVVDSTSSHIGSILRREYSGTDAQITFHTPAGITTIRGEYIWGQQPGTSATSASPGSQPTTDAYLRQFEGGYFYFVQGILQTKHKILFKYDFYDPNTDISGNNIGIAGSKTSATDIAYTTVGLGWIYHYNSNVKITAYYDRVTNETTSAIKNNSTLKNLTKDRNDNVFTLRVQYKF